RHRKRWPGSTSARGGADPCAPVPGPMRSVPCGRGRMRKMDAANSRPRPANARRGPNAGVREAGAVRAGGNPGRDRYNGAYRPEGHSPSSAIGALDGERAAMNIFLAYAHLEPQSFNAVLKDTAVAALRTAGHVVQVSDL